MKKVEIEVTKDFTSPTLGNMYEGKKVSLHPATAQKFVDTGCAKFTDADEADDDGGADEAEQKRLEGLGKFSEVEGYVAPDATAKDTVAGIEALENKDYLNALVEFDGRSTVEKAATKRIKELEAPAE